jgi:hypothetical protein
MPRARQASHDVAAHPAEADHADLHFDAPLRQAGSIVRVGLGPSIHGLPC